MTSPAGQQGDRAAADLKAIRGLLEKLNANLDAMLAQGQAAGPTFSRPAAVPPHRMEQLARAPEPTADLDDLVDLLVPRLVEQLVPALREALRDES